MNSKTPFSSSQRLHITKAPWIGTALLLFSLGLVGIISGNLLITGSLPAAVLRDLGIAILTLAAVEVLHEYFIARRVRDEFQILGDFMDKGVQRLCSADEITRFTEELLPGSRSLAASGLGLSWLFRSGAKQLQDLLDSGGSAKILVPDPRATDIRSRYANSEPSERIELGLLGLTERLSQWDALLNKYPNRLDVRVYDSYPSVSVTILDRHVCVSSFLYKLRGVDSHTIIYRRPSPGAQTFEEHFRLLYDDSKPLRLYLETYQDRPR